MRRRVRMEETLASPVAEDYTLQSPLARNAEESMYGALEDADAGAVGGSNKRRAAVDPEVLRTLQRAHRWNAVVPVASSLLAGAALVLQLGEVVGSLGIAYTALALAVCFLIATLTVGSMAALASNQADDTQSGSDSAEQRRPDVGGLFTSLHHTLGGPFGQLVGLMLFLSCALGATCSLLGLSELALHFVGAKWAASTSLPWNSAGSWAVVSFASVLLAVLIGIAGFAPSITRRGLRWVFALSVMAILGMAVSLSLPRALANQTPGTTAPVSVATGWSIAHLVENLAPHRPQQFRRVFSTLVAFFIGLLATSHVTHDAVTSRSQYARAHSTGANGSYRCARYVASQQLAIMGIHKALALSAGAYIAIFGVLAASASPSSLLSNRFVVPDSVDHVLGVVFVFMGVAASSLLSAFANITGAACIFSTFFGSNVRWAATFPDSIGDRRQPPRESGPSNTNDSSSSWMVAWKPTAMRFAVTWVVSQGAILCCGALPSAMPLVAPTTLLAFSTLNFACFFNEIASTSFRPSFRMYSQWTALLGSTLSLGACFLIVSPVFIIVSSLSLLGYVVLYHRELARFIDDLRVAHRMRSKRRRRDAVDERILQEEALTPLGTQADVAPVAAPSDVEQRPLNAWGDDMDTENKRLELAALFVRDASDGRFLGNEYLIDGLNRTHYKRLYHALHYVRMANMVVLIALTFFETPAWCFFSPNCGKSSTQILTWDLPVMPQSASLAVELICLTLLAGELAIKYRYMGRRIYFLNKWYIAQIVVLLADCAAVLTVAFVPLHDGDVDGINTESEDSAGLQDAVATRPLVLAPLIRPLLLLTMSHRLRSGFSSLLKSLPRFIDGLLTLSILVALYAVLGMVLFEGTREAQAYFSNFVEACTSLMVLLTTANFPDVMMPIYSQSRVASLFFMSFLAIGQLLVMNLVFASVYQHYRQEIVDRAALFAQQKKKALEAAFHLLPAHHVRSITGDVHETHGTKSHDVNEVKIISRRTYQRLLTELVRPTISLFDDFGNDEHARGDTYQQRDQATQGGATFYSHWSDEEEENWITYDDFVALINSFLAREKKSSATSQGNMSHRYHRHMQRLHRSRQTDRVSSFVHWMRALPAHPYFEPAVDLVMLVNLVAIILEIQAKISGQQELFLAWEAWSPVFSVVFVAEVLLKMSALGVGAYVDRTRNVFDCLVTLVIVAAEVSVHAHNLAGEWRWIRVLLLLRFLRCLRLLVALQALSAMVATVVRLLPAFTTLYGMLGVVMALYGVLGMQVFGGKLIVGDPRLARIAYGQANYYSNNFNDFASALTTLFELLIVNNWFVIMDGAVAVTSKWSRLFFISYYVVAVVMVLSLLVAFVVEAYIETTQADSERRGSKRSNNSSRLGDASTSSDGRDGSFSTPYSRSPSASMPPPSSGEHGKRLLTQRGHGSATPGTSSATTRDSIFVEDFL